jgi:hypothetical protein
MSSSTAETKPDESDPIDGTNAQVGDQLHGNDHRKRSRPTGGSEGSHDKSNNPEDTGEGEQEYHQTAEDGRPKIATRARGSSGIPPRGKLELEDLQGMSEDEVMRALYEDPELAAAAAAAAAADKSGFASSNSAGQTGIPKIQAGKRVDGLKERGFPFVQWAVLLLLLGLATHQIYKSMLTPSATKSRAKKTSKAKNGKAVKSGTVKNKQTPSIAAEDEKELLDTKTEVIPPAKQSMSEKSYPSSKKKKVKTKKTKVASSTTEENGTTSMSQKKSAVTETSNQDDGWTTVGKESDPKPKVEAKNGSSKLAVKFDASTAVTEENKVTTGSNEFQPVAKSKKKNKSKKKQEDGASSNHDNTSEQLNGIEEDAALAMELQKYEERALASETIESSVDVWEEVKPKKRK